MHQFLDLTGTAAAGDLQFVFLDRLPVAIVVADRSGTIIWANHHCVQLMGIDLEKLRTRPFQMLVVGQHSSRLDQLLEKAFANQPLAECVFELQTLPVPLHVSVRAALTPDSRSCYMVITDITASVQARQSLIEQTEVSRSMRQRLDELVSSTGGIVWEADAQTFQFTYVNDEAERLLGYPVSRWTDEPTFWADHIHPDDQDQAIRFCSESTGRLESHQFEYRMIAADGREVWLYDSVNVISEDGQPRFLRGMMLDITPLKTLETERAGLNRLLEVSLNEIYVCDAESMHFLYVNKGAIENLGYTADELSGMTPLDVAREFDPSAMEKLLAPLVSGSKSSIMFYTNIYRADKTHYAAEVHLYSSLYAGRPAYLAMVLDITERRASEEFHQMLMDNVSSAFVLVDQHAKIRLANRETLRLFGYSQAELLDQSITRLLPLNILDGFSDVSSASFDTLSSATLGEKGELVVKRQDGSEFMALLELSPTVISGECYVLVNIFDITETLRIQQQMLKSREDYQRVVDHIHDALLIDDIDGRVVYCNQRFLDYFGLAESDLSSLTIEDYVAPEYWAQVRSNHQNRMAGKAVPEVCEFEGVHRNGTRLWLQARTVPIMENGSPRGTQTIFLDLTETRRITTELVETRQHIQDVINTVNGIVWESRYGEPGFKYVSEQCETLLGYPAARLLSDANFWRDRMHPDDRVAALKMYDDFPATMVARDIEYRMRAATGAYVWISDSVVMVKRPGKPTILRGVMLDITERKRVEAELEHTRNHAEDVINSVEGIVWESHVDTLRFSYVSQQAERLLGYPVSRWLEDPNFWLNRIHPDDRKHVIDQYSNVDEQDHIRRVEYRMIAADGREVWIDDQVTVIRIKGRPSLLRGVMVDITERKQVMSALSKLGGRQIRMQEEERGRIARELHDDFGQRLAFIGLRLQILGNDPPEPREKFTEEMDELWRETKLLSTDLHNLSRELAPTKLRELGLEKSIASLCRQYLKLYSLPVEFSCRDLPEDLEEEIALSLYRITQEALQNVQKHSGAKDAAVHLSVAGDQIHMVISDTGCGYREAEHAPGQSLGMFSMAERAHLVGGRLAIESPRKGGTRITVTVPTGAAK